MNKRVRLEEEPEELVNSYFTSKKQNLQFSPTGCTVLDCALGGGYVLGRVENIVGDKSTAKTGLATEALTNFLRCYPNGKAAYRETEGAFDIDYAAAMGLPIDDIDFGDAEEPVTTIEAFDRDFNKFVSDCKRENTPGMYVLDSFDALSDEEELKRDISEGSYNMVKQKKVGIMFRKFNKRIESANVCLIVVSQVRENINALFGEKYRRSGGKALDFHTTHIFWLAHLKTLKRTVNKVERAYGMTIQAKVKKNKVSFNFRDATFNFLNGYGIDDLEASVNFLKTHNRLKDANLNENGVKTYLAKVNGYSKEEYDKECLALGKIVKVAWNEIEESFLPKRRKYS